MTHAPVRGGRVVLVAAALVVAAVVGALVATLVVATRTVPRTHDLTATDMNGTVVTLDGVASPPAAAASAPVPRGGGRLVVPAVGLDVPLGSLDMVGGEITPPGFRSAYVIRNLGVPLDRGAEGTVFVVMHALRGGGRGPGNYLTDIATGTATVRTGDEIELAGVAYRVDRWRSIGKRSIGRASDVWADVPGRLVLITCLERPDGSASTHNLVVIASRE